MARKELAKGVLAAVASLPKAAYLDKKGARRDQRVAEWGQRKQDIREDVEAKNLLGNLGWFWGKVEGPIKKFLKFPTNANRDLIAHTAAMYNISLFPGQVLLLNLRVPGVLEPAGEPEHDYRNDLWTSVAEELRSLLQVLLFGRGDLLKDAVAAHELRSRAQAMRVLFLPSSWKELASMGKAPLFRVVLQDPILPTGILVRIAALLMYLVVSRGVTAIFSRLARRRSRQFARQKSSIFIWNVLFAVFSALGLVAVWWVAGVALRAMNDGVPPRYSLETALPTELAASWVFVNMAGILTSATLMDSSNYMVLARDYRAVGLTLSQVSVVVAAVLIVVPGYLALRVRR
jgi:hypothetical protein